jgi:hypothetical protein
MNEDVYTEKLAWFKRNENPEAVLVIADDSELMKIVVAWTTLDVRPAQKLTDPPDEPDRKGWDWLWANADYSVEDLAEKSGLTAPLVERKLRPLIGNRVLYPDGTVNSFVQRYLRERVLKLFDAKLRKSTKGV